MNIAHILNFYFQWPSNMCESFLKKKKKISKDAPCAREFFHKRKKNEIFIKEKKMKLLIRLASTFIVRHKK